jgi:hypothetical protein
MEKKTIGGKKIPMPIMWAVTVKHLMVTLKESDTQIGQRTRERYR